MMLWGGVNLSDGLELGDDDYNDDDNEHNFLHFYDKC